MVVFVMWAQAAAAQTISMHATNEVAAAQGNLISFEAQTSGLLSNPNVFFYVKSAAGILNLGRDSNPGGDPTSYIWNMDWIAGYMESLAGGTGSYQVYAVLKNGPYTDSTEVARSQEITVTVAGSAITMLPASSAYFVAGMPISFFAQTTGILSNPTVFFYKEDSSGVFLLGKDGNPSGDTAQRTWDFKWNADSSGSFKVFSVLRNGPYSDSPEVARSEKLVTVPKGTSLPQPFTSVAGGYSGLIAGTPTTPLLTIQLAPSGAFTGSLQQNGLTKTLKGVVASSGLGTVSWVDPVTKTQTLLTLSISDSSGIFTGSFQSGASLPVPFALSASAYSGASTDISPLNGKTMNAVLEYVADGQALPLGTGFAQFKFDKKGSARLAGRLPDGSTLTATLRGIQAGLTGEVTLPVYLVWKGKVMSTLIGELTAKEVPATQTPDLTGDLEWGKPADPKRIFLPSGFHCTLSATGTLWTEPKNLNALTGLAEEVDFHLLLDRDSNILASAVDQAGHWPATNKPVLAAPLTGLQFTATQKTGAFSGKVILPSQGGAKPKSATFQGLLLGVPLEELDGTFLCGAGFLLGPDASAAVEVNRD